MLIKLWLTYDLQVGTEAGHKSTTRCTTKKSNYRRLSAKLVPRVQHDGSQGHIRS
jgi:hypothetical protein